ncbi:MAG: hypothetical protein AAGK14_14545 [Verrucomicrobiota bacterium]
MASAAPPIARPPGRWLKFLLALCLLPAAGGLVWALWDITVAWLPGEGWRSPWALAFAGGFALWVLVYVFLPRPMWLYVFGHEFTHALAIILSRGRVKGFHVSSRGGHVATDTVNWYIALSPYFVPLYTLIWMALWMITSFWWREINQYETVLFFGIGLTLGFHITFTIGMIHREQSDLIGQGWLFSFVVIVGINVLILLLLTIPIAENITWRDGALTVGERIRESYEGIWWLAEEGWRRLRPA